MAGCEMERRQGPSPARGRRLIIWALFMACLGGVDPVASGAQSELDAGEPEIQVIHGAPAIGAVDLYIDGGLVFIGLTFGAVSDPISLPAGGRAVTIVPSGQPPVEALLETTMSLAAGTLSDVALLGTAESLTLGVFLVDLSPLPPDVTRLGAVLGSPDTGPVDIAVTGGDQVFPTVEYGGATEFADLVAGAYDFEVRYAGTTSVALALPGTALEAGVVYRLYLVGEAAIGQLQFLFVSRPAEPVVIEGHPAWIHAGICGAVDPALAVADLTIVALSPFAAPVGDPAATPAQSSFTTVGVAFDMLTATAHSVVVADSAERLTSVIACGEIGGTPAADGSLIVGLRQVAASGMAGVAVLSPNVLDPALTDVSVFLAADLAGVSAAGGTEAGEPDAAAARVPIAAATPAAVP